MNQLKFHTTTARRQLPGAVVTIALTLCLSSAVSTAALAAEASPSPPTLGQTLIGPTLKDQRDLPWVITPATKLVLFAAGRKASTLVQTVLQDQPKDYLVQRHALYLADMSKMPGFVTRTFALPALREMPFSIGVSLDEAVLAGWPRQPDAVTLLELQQGVVKHIRYAATEAELRAALAR
jgi:hypothetical protein